ncbi:phytanoyl-CoA dioxygenase family protein [Pseudomonas sp. ML96]|uniref:phytanoyl-CoA dioxygenase family protein n=1 Tax=Pseudomonas sp. ML96 TaxID=1523503 RepID=UPI0009E0756B|nr:phytanoyl-CoA dioxygenase family protein [Pseudomonas sp. ML96]
MLSEESLREFQQYGMCVIPAFHDVEREILPIQKGIYQIIGLVAQRHGVELQREPFQGSNFDSGYLQLLAKSRVYGAEVYDLVKQIPAFIRLISAPESEHLFSYLRKTDSAGIGKGSYGIRIDIPNEEAYRSQWHQEFIFQPQSIDGLVFWTPLVEVSLEMGPVIVCAGSHKDGLCQYTKGGAYSEKSGAYKIGIHDEECVVSKYEHVAPLTKPGDLIIMDYLTIHQSGFNVSDRTRWSVQSRFFNFNDPVGMAIGWKESVTAGAAIESIFPQNFIR